jgi:hypothetical protein
MNLGVFLANNHFLSAETEETRLQEATETTVSKRWWTSVQKDQRDNVSKYLVQIWSMSQVPGVRLNTYKAIKMLHAMTQKIIG